MQRLKVGIVGTGFIGGRHMDAISRIPEAEIVAVVDPYSVKVQEYAAIIGAKVYDSVDEMLEKEVLDVVHNCTPTSMHYRVNAKIIKAGRHLYCEKPLSLTAAEGDALLKLLTEHPVANGVNLNYRMNTLIQELHERVKTETMGKAFLVSGNYLQDWMLKQDDYDWRLDPELGGASRAIADIGSHLFDTSQYVLGKKIVAVNARLMRLHDVRMQHEKPGGTFSAEKGKLIAEVPVVNEDAASIMVRFDDGANGMFLISQVAAGHKNDMRLQFDFETCSYEWRQEENNLLYIGHRDEPNQILQREEAALTGRAKAFNGLPAGHPEGWNDALYQAIKAFYQSISTDRFREGDVPYATIAEGAWIMRIIEACLLSDKCGQWVDVQRGEII